ncbi:hypothetical protein GA0070607_1871 [Micromonospora coriariae]|uniref:Uncharacterized protein n=1 Tax=Micromonospora coriariae TaxID=285665 RepID=A0A1C4VBI9_9ACTN|nr:hypothetical protein [Micromonospora coriariae]SCE81201.1 hypothetical protein GA0070607_1871 [Micromonospora coriariae]
MPAGPLRAAPVTTLVEATEPRPPLDYYLVLAKPGDRGPAAGVEGIVVEEFTRHADFSTAGLDSAGWTPSGDGWWSSASFSRSMRTDREALARLVPSSRRDADSAYRQLGGGQLPSEAVLRTYFRDHQPFASAPPLRLGPAQPPTGFHERRVYRVLFAKDLRADQVESLRTLWRTTGDGAPADPRSPGAVVAGCLDEDGDRFAWDVRRVGSGLAWCLDVTVLLRTKASGTLGSTLHNLTTVMRQHGLIPVTTERFS